VRKPSRPGVPALIDGKKPERLARPDTWSSLKNTVPNRRLEPAFRAGGISMESARVPPGQRSGRKAVEM